MTTDTTVSRSPIVKPAAKGNPLQHLESALSGLGQRLRPAAKAKAKGKAAKKGKARAAKPAAKKVAKPAKAKAPRVTKQSRLIEMLKRPDGADSGQIQKAFDWQAHTVRGAIAGALKKGLGLKVTAERDEKRGTVYRIKN